LIDVQSVGSRIYNKERNASELWPQNASKVIARQYLYGILSFIFLCSNLEQRETVLFLEKLYRLSNSKIFTMRAALTVKTQNFLDLRNYVFRSEGFQRYLSTLVNFHNVSTNWWRKQITSAVLRSQGLLPVRFRYYFCLGSFQYVANTLFELIVILIKKKVPYALESVLKGSIYFFHSCSFISLLYLPYFECGKIHLHLNNGTIV